jgi:hypothetical protein
VSQAARFISKRASIPARGKGFRKVKDDEGFEVAYGLDAGLPVYGSCIEVQV